MSDFKLTTELIKLSQSPNWSDAKLEWELVEVEKVEEPEECLCGHFPIIEICTIRNNKTNSEARVGNCCVKKFNDKSDKIFRSLAKIKKDINKSINLTTLDWSLKSKWINQNDYDFYKGILNKRQLSEKQIAWKKDINKKIIKSQKNRVTND